jgi:penicillin amidase
VIRTKSGDQFEIAIFLTSNGPLDISGVQLTEEQKGLSSVASSMLSNGFYLSRASSLDPFHVAVGTASALQLIRASNVEEAMDHGSKLHISLNLVMGDKSGNIAYQKSGSIPRRHANASGLLPLLGWDLSQRWAGHLDPSEMVSVLNPSSGLVVSANNDVMDQLEPDVDQSEFPLSLNLHMGSHRRERILERLHQVKLHTVESMQSIQMDLRAPDYIYRLIMDTIRPSLEQLKRDSSSRSAAELMEWDGNYAKNSTGAVIYEEIYLDIMNEVYGESVFGREAWRLISYNSDLFLMFASTFDRPIFDTDTDPLRVFEDESREELFRRIADQVVYRYDSMQTTPKWGEYSNFTMGNILFREKKPFAWFGYDYGPVESDGARGVVCQVGISEVHGRRKAFAPSWRMVSDLGQDFVTTTLPGGPSGSRWSPLYTIGIDDHFNARHKQIPLFY